MIALVSIEWVYLGYTLVVSWILLKVIDATMGIRLTEEDEVVGLDSVEHSETACNN